MPRVLKDRRKEDFDLRNDSGRSYEKKVLNVSTRIQILKIFEKVSLLYHTPRTVKLS